MSAFLWFCLGSFGMDALSRAVLLSLSTYPRNQRIPAWIDVVQMAVNSIATVVVIFLLVSL